MRVSTVNLHAEGLTYNMSPSNTPASAQASTTMNKSFSAVFLGQSSGLPASQRIDVKTNDELDLWYQTGIQKSAQTSNISGGLLPSTDVRVAITPHQGAVESVPFRVSSSLKGTYVRLFS